MRTRTSPLFLIAPLMLAACGGGSIAPAAPEPMAAPPGGAAVAYAGEGAGAEDEPGTARRAEATSPEAPMPAAPPAVGMTSSPSKAGSAADSAPAGRTGGAPSRPA